MVVRRRQGCHHHPQARTLFGGEKPSPRFIETLLLATIRRGARIKLKDRHGSGDRRAEIGFRGLSYVARGTRFHRYPVGALTGSSNGLRTIGRHRRLVDTSWGCVTTGSVVIISAGAGLAESRSRGTVQKGVSLPNRKPDCLNPAGSTIVVALNHATHNQQHKHRKHMPRPPAC